MKKPKTITLEVVGGIKKEFGLAHAQAILIHQSKVKCTSNWVIVGSDYEFNNGELNGVSTNTGSTKGKAKSMVSPTGKDSAK